MAERVIPVQTEEDYLKLLDQKDAGVFAKVKLVLGENGSPLGIVCEEPDDDKNDDSKR